MSEGDGQFSPDGQWRWTGGQWTPVVPAQLMPVSRAGAIAGPPVEGRIKVARWIAWPLLLIGVGAFFWAPSPNYQGQTFGGTPTSLAASCVSPWTSWSDHTYATATDSNGAVLIPVDQSLADQACMKSIKHVEVFGAVGLVFGLVGLAVISHLKRRVASDQAAP